MSRPESRRDENLSEDQAARRQGRARRGARSFNETEPSATQNPNGARDPEEIEPQGGGQTSGQAEPFFGWSFRDFLVPYVLLALSMQRAHGYVIEQYLHGLGLANVELSTLYRTLRQLEKNGLVYSTWEPGPEGPARRIYSLTDAGRWWLDAGAATLAGYRDIIDRFFGNYEGPFRGANGDDNEKGVSR